MRNNEKVDFRTRLADARPPFSIYLTAPCLVFLSNMKKVWLTYTHRGYMVYTREIPSGGIRPKLPDVSGRMMESEVRKW